MGQKIHPLSLRIHSSTRSFDNAWYSEYFFSKLLSIDFEVQKYLNTFLKVLKLPHGRFAFIHFPKSTKIYNFFCYPKYSREAKAKIFQISTGLSTSRNLFSQKKSSAQTSNGLADLKLYQKIASSSNVFPMKYSTESILSLLPRKKIPVSSSGDYIAESSKNSQNFSKLFSHTQAEASLSHVSLSRVSPEFSSTKNSGDSTSRAVSQLKNFLCDWKHLHLQYPVQKNTLSHSSLMEAPSLPISQTLENSLSKYLPQGSTYIPLRVASEWQDAGYFADEIVFLLERRISFRQIKNRLLKQFSLNPHIQGVRITCSGRVGGKSKKAQRAKTESIHYGQTSLHIFASKIDFAVRTAHTALGSTGVKVWICYN